MPIPEQPFQAVSTDILGPFKPSKQTGNKYVLVFICYLTKYVELIPLSDIKAVTVANAFINNVICRHGTCDFLHSDRGTNYLSHIVRETCNLLNIKKTQTTSFHPQCKGQSERMMANITNQLAKHVDDSEESWDTFRHGPFDILGGGAWNFFPGQEFFFGQFWNKIIFFAGPSGRIIFFILTKSYNTCIHVEAFATTYA